MIKVIDVFDFLNKKFPVSDACDFDNVGILIGEKEAEVTGIVTALDCDVDTVNFALSKNANLIVTHHPVIFDSIKNLLGDSVPYILAKNKISVISMHTNFDVGKGGLNDVLAKKLELKSVKKFKADDGYILNSAVPNESDPEKLAAFIKEKLKFNVRFVGSKPINKLLLCSGSGGDYIDTALQYGFDALITADVKQHQFIKAINCGLSLFDAGHYATEILCNDAFYELLTKKFKGIEVFKFYQEKIKSI